MRPALTCVPLLLGSALAAPTLGVFSGTVGNLPIVMKLDEPESDPGVSDSAYFYTFKGLDLTLALSRDGQNITLNEYAPSSWTTGERPVTATFRGVLRGDTLRGTWRTADGKRSLPFNVRRVRPAGLPLALPPSPGLLRLRAGDPYTFLRLNHPLVIARREGDVTWLREPLSGVTYPRVAGRPGVNAALQDRQLQDAGDALTCRSDLGDKGQGADGGWQQEVKVTYRSKALLSLRSDASYFCGGVHPDAFTAGAIFDLRGDREVGLTALFPAATPGKLDAEYVRGYRTDVSDCGDVSAGAFDPGSPPSADDYAAFLTPRGVTLWPTYLPHVAAACADEVTVPFARLGPGTMLAPR